MPVSTFKLRNHRNAHSNYQNYCCQAHYCFLKEAHFPHELPSQPKLVWWKVYLVFCWKFFTKSIIKYSCNLKKWKKNYKSGTLKLKEAFKLSNHKNANSNHHNYCCQSHYCSLKEGHFWHQLPSFSPSLY